MSTHLAPFMNLATVASYARETPLKLPGLSDLHRMTAILLGENAPELARILVVGAGGGLELRAMADALPQWRFTGVDPSPPMLALARETSAAYTDRIELIEGTVDRVPVEPFDGATCLLTLHFLDRAERLRTFQEIHRRLKPGSTVVVAHHVALEPDPERWLARSVTFANRAGPDPAGAASAAKAMASRLPLMPSVEEEAIMREAGFLEPALFYAAFSFRGWFATAG